MPCYSPLEGYQSIANGGWTSKKSESNGTEMTVACGSCLGCRLDRSVMWAARIVHESRLHDANCFITLTYDDANLPYGATLVKEHFQKFMKRLRRKFAPVKIRYYQCGEYGDENDRPHYHACLFGLDFSDVELFQQKESYTVSTSRVLEELWGKGFTTVAPLTYESAAYVARYCLKKITGHQATEHYKRLVESTGEIIDLQPEYATMSRGRPCRDHRSIDLDCPDCEGGIGAKWYWKYRSDFFPSDDLPIPGRGVLKKVPRFYETMLQRTDPDLLEEVKKTRKKFRSANLSEYTPRRLMDKYKVKKAQISQLRRPT